MGQTIFRTDFDDWPPAVWPRTQHRFRPHPLYLWCVMAEPLEMVQYATLEGLAKQELVASEWTLRIWAACFGRLMTWWVLSCSSLRQYGHTTAHVKLIWNVPLSINIRILGCLLSMETMGLMRHVGGGQEKIQTPQIVYSHGTHVTV